MSGEKNPLKRMMPMRWYKVNVGGSTTLKFDGDKSRRDGHEQTMDMNVGCDAENAGRKLSYGTRRK
jgi:hypothetical protein